MVFRSLEQRAWEAAEQHPRLAIPVLQGRPREVGLGLAEALRLMQQPSQAEAFSGRQRRRFHQRRCQPQADFAAGHLQQLLAADAREQPGGGDPGGAD